MDKENSESKKSAERDGSEIENDEDRISGEMDVQTENGSSESDERYKMNIPELEKRKEMKVPELKEDPFDLERRIIRNTSELKKRMKRNSSENSDIEKRTEKSTSELEKRMESDVSELEKRTEGSAVENETPKNVTELENRTEDGSSELEKRALSLNSHGEGNLKDETTERVDETNVPLLVGDSVSIEMKGGPEGTPTVRVHDKKSKEATIKKNKYWSPIQRMKTAWNNSSNVCTFFLRASLIIFTTLGWMMCVGGIPFVSIAMIAIGSLYFDNCKVQPNIPLYLVVSGVCGTIQHFIAFWNKYLPEESQGRLKVYRRYYSFIDGAMTFFLFIWFILGCVWVYGVKEVDYEDDFKDEYCHKTLYLFAFWLLNISFIIITIVMVLGLCAILCVVALPKDEVVV